MALILGARVFDEADGLCLSRLPKDYIVSLACPDAARTCDGRPLAARAEDRWERRKTLRALCGRRRSTEPVPQATAQHAKEPGRPAGVRT